MGLIFPVSTARSPLVATLYTFVVPPAQCCLAAAAVYAVLRHYHGDADWIIVLCGVLVVLGTASNFRDLNTQFQSHGEVTRRDALLDTALIVIKCAVSAVVGSLSYPWIRDTLVQHLTTGGWKQLAKFVFDTAPVLAVGVATLAAMFLSLLASHYRGQDALRGKRRSPLAAIRESFAKRRRAREDAREDRILRQIHRDGGTSGITASDMEFLSQRGAGKNRRRRV